MAGDINPLKAKRLRQAVQQLHDVNFMEPPAETICDGLYVSAGKDGPSGHQWLLFCKGGKVVQSCPVSANTFKRLRLELQLCRTVTSGGADGKFFERGA